MSNRELLSQQEIEVEISDIPLWLQDSATIVREIVAPNFAGAVGMINAIAVLAESADHHPDILLYGWNKIRVTLSTHDRGGLTMNDFKLAKKIEELGY
jgi:4a-hydroxytetrahydrobiopterin dehydratase